jgi:hypothetical protein
MVGKHEESEQLERHVQERCDEHGGVVDFGRRFGAMSLFSCHRAFLYQRTPALSGT